MMIFPRSHLVHHWATLQDNTHRTENLLKQVLHFTYEITYRHWTHVQIGIKPYRKIEERYDRTALCTLIKTCLRTGTKASTTGTVKALI